MANKTDNYLAHVEALKEFLPHAPELNLGAAWNNDFSYYKVQESMLQTGYNISTPHWSKIDIRKAVGIACCAPAGWVLALTDLPIPAPIDAGGPTNNIALLHPGDRIGIAKRDWIHATWLPCWYVGDGVIDGFFPARQTPNDKYAVVEYNPTSEFRSSLFHAFNEFDFTNEDAIVIHLYNNSAYHLEYEASYYNSISGHSRGLAYYSQGLHFNIETYVNVLGTGEDKVQGVLLPYEHLSINNTFTAPFSSTFFLNLLQRRM